MLWNVGKVIANRHGICKINSITGWKSNVSNGVMIAGGEAGGKVITNQHGICKINGITRWKRNVPNEVVIAGGGAGGISMAAKLRIEIPESKITIIEPSYVHYNQSMWPLVGGGIEDFKKSFRKMNSLIPKGVTWLQDSVTSFHPNQNMIRLKSGSEIKYDYLVIALGMKLGFEKIKGLPEALYTPGVCSVYASHTVEKTIAALKSFQKGNAIFTQPPAPIKCPGAAQSIAYLADDYLRMNGKRDVADIIFSTAEDTLYSLPKCAAELSMIAHSKGIAVHTLCNLIEVKSNTKHAIFQIMSNKLVAPLSTFALKYELLHVTPPMFPPDSISSNKDLCDETGYLDVSSTTLQHSRFDNIFGLGDCTNLPTSKTAAAVAYQSGYLRDNIPAVIRKSPISLDYDGYTACPVLTGDEKAVIPEFGYNLKPIETFPFDQCKEKYFNYILNKKILPFYYWNLMLRGSWSGPYLLRSILQDWPWHEGSR